MEYNKIRHFVNARKNILIMIFPRRLWKRIFSIGLLLVFLLFGSWYMIKWQKLKTSQDNVVKVSSTNTVSDVDLYNNELFFKVDGLGQYGITQSIWARSTDGQERFVTSIDYSNIDLYIKKSNTEYFSYFIKGVPQQNRYAFFRLQDLVSSPPEYRSSSRFIFFDKETKKIGEAFPITLVDNPVEFSPDYKYMAVLHSELKGEPGSLKFYVDIMDIATLEIVNRYYLPEHRTLYALTYSKDAGRADWGDNVWKSKTEYQIAQFDDRKNINSPWREDDETHSIFVKNKEEAMAVLAKTDHVILGLDNNKALYAQAEDGSFVEVDRNFSDRFEASEDGANELFATTSSTTFLFIVNNGYAGWQSLINIVAKNNLSDIPLGKVPQSLRDGDWGRMFFSPNFSKVFVVIDDSAAAEIIDLVTLKVINKITIPKGTTVFEHQNVSERVMEGYNRFFGNETRWLSNDIFELALYEAPVSQSVKKPTQIMRININDIKK